MAARGDRALKQHSTGAWCRRRSPNLATAEHDPKSFGLRRREGDTQPSLQRNVMTALLDENCRLVDQVRSVLRDLRRARHRIREIEAALATYEHRDG
jgi:hypothetical protein